MGIWLGDEAAKTDIHSLRLTLEERPSPELGWASPAHLGRMVGDHMQGCDRIDPALEGRGWTLRMVLSGQGQPQPFWVACRRYGWSHRKQGRSESGGVSVESNLALMEHP